jgi:hypothetical protein
MKTIIALTLLATVYPALARDCAPPRPSEKSCMLYDPDQPKANPAPLWAVAEMRKQADPITNSRYDPIWQHAFCDGLHHTIRWCLPGGE